ncbi:DUF5333 domain-containing protein [Shimia thalassica]|jgi:uncharacterized membrane protein|uniref:DUF5333 domain-containing protein n=1 Tax=Shimia thalassica TaxID=1715693 RepID=UPI002494811F|nr:DUF5333 domain-containing protein [Shimia thalassica]MDO6480237.1 DUF5333 domain-containing protein [Shimia thalassica]MDO6520975.1 DUF5333 domain-containing protein [Shimia thalassica]MDP2517650.1 DUF5333 domain-containing protein [Shimia thalassica]MDP2581646.1 DUF5333 domain-containing protein [Shimia thalassica]
MRKVLLAVSAVFAVTGSAAQAKAPMSDVPEIENVLYAAAVAYEISEICDDISARRMKALGDAWKLRSIANDLGYSDSEIKEYIESDAQKARMRAKGEAYLKSKGAIYGQPETFCAVGRAEIAKSSAIGALLRAK